MGKAGASTFVIAEAGVNHNGALDMAMELIHAASESGADAVKFQTFDSSKLVLQTAEKAAYQQRNTRQPSSQYEMLRALELSREAHIELRDLCRKCSIEFMSSPFDVDSVRFLAEDVQVSRLKIPSGEIVNGVLLLAAARTGLPLIVSTGMCELGEILESLSILVWGSVNREGLPVSRASLAELREREDWIAPLRGRVSVLQCVTQYPAPPATTNLRAMGTLAAATGLEVGFSDHSTGWHIPLAAVAAGARVIEKHFTLSRRLPGPDHIASLEPDELGQMVRQIREVEAALGDGVKRPSSEELDNRVPARGSLVTQSPVCRGEAFSADNLTVKRPGNGVSPYEYWDYVAGTCATRDYAADEALDVSNVPSDDAGERE